MYQIAVCDDDIYFLDKFTKTLLYAWGEEQVEIQTYQDGQTLLEDVERGNRYQVFFLDIQLASENGIDVARKLKIYSSDSVLIYVSAMEECIFQTFQTFPFWFVRKGKLDEDLRQMLPELRKELLPRQRRIVLQAYNKIFYLNVEKILYIESQNKEIIVRMDEECIRIRYQIGDIERILKDQGFIRIHKGYLANTRRISRVRQGEVVMDNQVHLPVSRSKIKEIEEEVMKNMFGEEWIK